MYNYTNERTLYARIYTRNLKCMSSGWLDSQKFTKLNKMRVSEYYVFLNGTCELFSEQFQSLVIYVGI